MERHYNLTGTALNDLIAAVEDILGQRKTRADGRKPWSIGPVTINRNGLIRRPDAFTLERLAHNLIADGFWATEDTPC